MTDFDLVPGVLHRGLGFVARWPGITVVIPSDPVQDRAVEEMLAVLGPDPAPAEVVQAIEQRLQTGSVRDIGYLATAAGGPVAMVAGGVEVVVDGDAVLTGMGGPTERHLAANERITMRAAKLAKAAEAAYPYDLRRGIAPGAGITLGVPIARDARAPSAPPHPVQMAPDIAPAPPPEAPAVELPFASFLLVDDDRPPAPLDPLPVESGVGGSAPAAPSPGAGPADPARFAPSPLADPAPGATIVEGIVCSRGHFNNPDTPFCLVCGISMVHVTHNLVPGQRPTLGFVVFDDGSTFGLDRSYLIGREPGEPPDAKTAPLTIQDNNETLSRRHAELRLVGWSVHLIDLGSTNGSFIWDLNMERWTQLAPSQAVELAPGDTIALGRRTFVYESVTRP